WTAGSRRPMSAAMIAITTSSSISVKPCRLLVVAARSIAVPRRLGARALTLPTRCLLLLPVSGAPDLEFPLAPVAPAGGQAPAAGAERHPQDVDRVAPEQGDLLACPRVPEPHGLVPAGRGEKAAIGAKGQVGDAVGLRVNRAAHQVAGHGVTD